MYAINEGRVEINSVPVETFEREVRDGKTALRVQAGTTGYRGGGRAAGGRKAAVPLLRHGNDISLRMP